MSDIRARGVYAVFNDTILMYVGSSVKKLHELEHNHRNWQTLGYDPTKFRRKLAQDGKDWHFVWLVIPYACTQHEIETKEGMLIRLLNPRLNIDRNPVESSIKYGRYTTDKVI